MATTVTISGSVTVADPGSAPIITATIQSETPTITQQSQGQIKVAAATTIQVPFGAMTTASFIHLRFFDVSLGTAKNTVVLINPATVTLTLPAAIEHLTVSNDVNAGPTSLKITTGAGNETRVEYELAGT